MNLRQLCVGFWRIEQKYSEKRRSGKASEKWRKAKFINELIDIWE
jgi:hypothetical protein